jgi:toxin CcdB
MARYDYYRNPAGAGYLLDVQSDLTAGLSTRVVIPLLSQDRAPMPAKRLNPLFAIGGASYVMATQFLAAIPASELRDFQGSLERERDAIVNALDMLFFGF